MAVRVLAADVLKILEVDSTVVADLDPHIETANSLVNRVCLDSSYSEETLTVIEKWLAAHFVAVHDTRFSSEKAGTSVKYQVVTQMHLDATLWGQQAIILDTEGNLASLNMQAKKGSAASIGVAWLGTAKE